MSTDIKDTTAGDRRRRYWAKQRKEVGDAYVKLILRNCGRKKIEVTPEMIKIKRTEIIMSRIKKKIKEAGFRICGNCKRKLPDSSFYYKFLKSGRKHFTKKYCKNCENGKQKNPK